MEGSGDEASPEPDDEERPDAPDVDDEAPEEAGPPELDPLEEALAGATA